MQDNKRIRSPRSCHRMHSICQGSGQTFSYTSCHLIFWSTLRVLYKIYISVWLKLENHLIFFQVKDRTEMIITEENIIGVSLVKITMESLVDDF